MPGLNGGYAELVCVDADAAVKVPAGIAPEEACVAACTIGTELNAIREVGRVQIGERVLVTGAGGGLGYARRTAFADGRRLYYRGDDVASQSGTNPRGRRG